MSVWAASWLCSVAEASRSCTMVAQGAGSDGMFYWQVRRTATLSELQQDSRLGDRNAGVKSRKSTKKAAVEKQEGCVLKCWDSIAVLCVLGEYSPQSRYSQATQPTIYLGCAGAKTDTETQGDRERK